MLAKGQNKRENTRAKKATRGGPKNKKKLGLAFWGEVGGIVARIVARIRIERPAVDEGRKKPSIIPNNRKRRGTEP